MAFIIQPRRGTAHHQWIPRDHTRGWVLFFFLLLLKQSSIQKWKLSLSFSTPNPLHLAPFWWRNRHLALTGTHTDFRLSLPAVSLIQDGGANTRQPIEARVRTLLDAWTGKCLILKVSSYYICLELLFKHADDCWFIYLAKYGVGL